ncbi:MAG: isochorismatase family protein [Anaerolineaceae bacterium]|nr:isochorismatase family protein [Anaerolineaceae bacterium]
MKPALLVIDVQKAFFEHNPLTAQSLNQAIETINPTIALFRKKQLPVICIQNIDREGPVVPGAEGFEVPDHLTICTTDIHIHKMYKNSFCKTALGETLRELGVDTVIVTGFCAEHCVLSTYRGGDDLDLTPLILRGAIASGISENIKFVESVNDIISFRALERFLD